MPARIVLESPTERQLLVQLGERMRQARTALGVSMVDLAKRLGISRTTLRAVEAGEPSPTIGTYVRVLGALGLASDLVLVGAGERRAAQEATAQVSDPDLISRALHAEVVRMVAARPSLRVKARSLLARPGVLDSLSTQLAQRLRRAVEQDRLADLLEDSPEGRVMRQVSPLTELVPISRRDAAVSRFVRSQQLLEELRPRVGAALKELRRRGADASVVGSFSWGGFTEGSDVDVLVSDSGDLSDGVIYDIVARHLQKMPFDIVHLARMTPSQRRYLIGKSQAGGARPLHLETSR